MTLEESNCRIVRVRRRHSERLQNIRSKQRPHSTTDYKKVCKKGNEGPKSVARATPGLDLHGCSASCVENLNTVRPMDTQQRTTLEGQEPTMDGSPLNLAWRPFNLLLSLSAAPLQPSSPLLSSSHYYDLLIFQACLPEHQVSTTARARAERRRRTKNGETTLHGDSHAELIEVVPLSPRRGEKIAA
jgi:hypothetical protein